VQCIPRSTKGTLALDFQGRIRFSHDTAIDIDTVLVLESSVRSLPGRDAAATAAQSDIRLSYPAGSKAIEEISLAGDLAVVHECISKFADVDLGGLVARSNNHTSLTYGVLVAQKAGVIESAIGIRQAQCQAGPSSPWQVVIDEI
jgi:hypothetical protein